MQSCLRHVVTREGKSGSLVQVLKSFLQLICFPLLVKTIRLQFVTHSFDPIYSPAQRKLFDYFNGIVIKTHYPQTLSNMSGQQSIKQGTLHDRHFQQASHFGVVFQLVPSSYLSVQVHGFHYNFSFLSFQWFPCSQHDIGLSTSTDLMDSSSW